MSHYNTNTESDANGEQSNENGDKQRMSRDEARAHLAAIAETDLPYSAWAEQALRAMGEWDEDEGGLRDE